MKRTSWWSSALVLRRVGLATICAAAVCAGAILPGANPAGAAVSAKKLALEAVAQFRGDGKVGMIGQLRVKGASTTHHATKRTSNGAVLSSTDETYAVHDRGGTFFMDLAVIDNTQTVVVVINPASGAATDLVLAPGTSTITQQVPLTQASGSGGPPADIAAVQAGDWCPGGTYNPSVVGTIYGPLIQAPSVLTCVYPDTLNVITEVNEWVGWVKGIGSGGIGGYGTYLFANAFAYCNPGLGLYLTTGLWQAGGDPPASGYSTWVLLPCALQ